MLPCRLGSADRDPGEHAAIPRMPIKDAGLALGRDDEARQASERALALAGNPAERELLARRLSF